MTKLKQLRTRCFFDVSIAQDSIGRIIFELYNDVCPKTCENFKALCTGERGIGKFTGKPLHYKDVLFHRVVKNFMIQSGDFSQGNGKGGESIYGGTFEDESFDFKHDEAFLLSMANRGKNTNGSQFFITLAPAPHLDGVHVVFGHVIAGQDVVTKIANQAVDKNARPFVEVRISNCGELIPQIKSKDVKKKKESKKSKRSDSEDSSNDSSDSDSSSSDSDSSSSDSGSDSSSDNESSRRKKDAASEKNENEVQRGSTKNGQVAIPISDLPNAPKVYANIKADEIPDVPPNRFLARNFKPKETTKEENGDSERPTDRRRDGRREYSHRVSYSRSGRKVKGRGFLRYRTPSPDHDRDRFRRSETPPHWKSAQARLKSLKEVITPTTTTPREAEHKNGQEKPRRRPSYEDRPRSSRHRRSRSRSTSRDRQRSRRNESSRRRSSSRSPDRDRRRKRSRSSSRESNHAKEAKESLESAKRQLSAPKRPLEVRDEYEE